MSTIQTRFFILVLIFQLLLAVTRTFAQENKPIKNFYLFANQNWLDSLVLPENYIVINQAGILWEKVEQKTIEILNDSFTYNLDKDYTFALNQLRNFYNCTSEVYENDIKRLAIVQKNFPTILGIVFSKITVTSQKEEMVKEIIKYLTLAYRNKIENSNIIGDYYKKLFREKLDNLKIEIGAPLLSNFPKMPILSNKSYTDNLQIAESYQKKIAKTVTDWHTPPYETDCFYFANSNKINIYAGTLFDFNSNDDTVYLFATLGRTIAHEMTHAFDMVRKDYDEEGKSISFLEKLISGAYFYNYDLDAVFQKLIIQFNNYSINDTLFVDGEKTLQENFADLGGVEVSLSAFKMFLNEKYQNISAEEQSKFLRKYFLHYTQFWKEKGTDEFVIASFKRIHTPQKFRAIGPIYNQNEFYEIYNIDRKSEYYIPEEQRVTIW